MGPVRGPKYQELTGVALLEGQEEESRFVLEPAGVSVAKVAAATCTFSGRADSTTRHWRRNSGHLFL